MSFGTGNSGQAVETTVARVTDWTRLSAETVLSRRTGGSGQPAGSGRSSRSASAHRTGVTRVSLQTTSTGRTLKGRNRTLVRETFWSRGERRRTYDWTGDTGETAWSGRTLQGESGLLQAQLGLDLGGSVRSWSLLASRSRDTELVRTKKRVNFG